MTASAASTTYVQTLYSTVLLRTGSTSDVNSWATLLDSGLLTQSQETTAFETSGEATSFVDPVIRMYETILHRAPDAAGLSGWVNAIRNGTLTLQQVAEGFVGSTEFQTLYGSSTPNPTAYVTALYNNVLNRAPDSAGLAGWTNALTSGQLDYAQVALGFSNSTEYIADSTAPINQWLTTAVANAAAGSTSPYPSTLTISIPGQTYTLPTTLTSITATAGSSTFNGVLSSSPTAQTIIPLDSITAVGSNNVFNISDISGGQNLPNISVTGVQTVNYASAGQTGTANFAGYAGLTTLNVTEIGGNAGTGITAAGTTAVNLSDTNQGAGNIIINGGGADTVNTVGQTTGTITVGAAAAPAAGAVTVKNTIASGTGGAITVNGGTAVNVTEATSNAVNTTVTESAVTVNGTASTTAVTISQAAATAAAAAVGATGVVGVTGVTAAPGVTGVTAVTAVAPVTASKGVAGANAGAVTITDAAYAAGQAGTIATVSLTNYGAGSAISDNSLGTLTLGGLGGALTINNNMAAAGTATLNLNLAGAAGANTITDTNNEIGTLKVTTSSADSKLAAITDTALTSLSVSGTNTLTLSAINASLKTVTISGGAGFSDGATTHTTGLAALGSALTLTTTSTGKVAVALDDAHQSFTGAAGQDIILISDLADATKTITAGSAVNNELILEGGPYALSAATAAKVTGFQILGVEANVTGTIDMSQIDATASGLDIIGNSTIAFTKVASGASVSLDASSTSVSVTYIDANGASDGATVTFGGATNATALTAGSLTLQDANLVGIGTINLVSNEVAFNSANTITTLVDNGLSHLNVSGSGGLTIGTLNEASTQATSFILNNTETNAAPVTISAFTDANLGSLTFTGSNVSIITALNDSASTLGISNTGTSAGIITLLTDNSLTSLTLGAGVSLGQAGTLVAEATIGLQDTSPAGVTVAGSADNAHVTLVLGGAAAGKTDTITLGNGNDYVIDASVAGTVNVTAGTGSNQITLGGTTTNTTGAFNVTLGAHTVTAGVGADNITAGTGGTAYASAANYVITGAVVGDTVTLAADATAAGTGAGGAVTLVTAGSSVATTINALETAVTGAGNAHHVVYSQFGGNTYFVDSASGTLGAGDTTVVELVGLHTFTAATGVVTVAT
ncbi:MAG TPA: DUF4214 domain-containing protein [Alphaproteobacteria bacterium]|nr:DUF4214 domain-containing protein [Alphaproteobacteria bacterium]